MSQSYPVISGVTNYRLPNWGRCFWQDPNDGQLFLAFASGDTEVDYVTSTDGQTWSSPEFLFPCDDFSRHSNFDIIMDRAGHVHCAFRYRNMNSYRFLGKVPGGGWTHSSGNGVFGYQMAGDSGVVAGYQGSMTIWECDPLGFNNVPGADTAWPQVLIASKGSGTPAGARDRVRVYRVERPYRSAPIFWDGPNDACGVEGGYPQIGPSNLEQPGLTYLNDSGTIPASGGRPIPTVEHWTYFFGYSLSAEFPANSSRCNKFMENMGIGSGLGPGPLTIVASNSGQDGFATVRTSTISATTRNAGHLTSISKPSLSWHNQYRTSHFGVSPTGTNCDFTHNDRGQQIVYFHHYGHLGQQNIHRLVGEYAYNSNTYGPSGVYIWGSRTSTVSGIVQGADVDRYNAGGNNGRANWIRMKALKHPTEPNPSGTPKKELVVLTSIPAVLPTGTMISVFDFKNSVAMTAPTPHPTYSINLCRTTMFSGVSYFEGGWFGNSSDLFDGLATNEVLMSQPANLHIDFYDKVHINKIEFWKEDNNFGWGTLSVSGSLDGHNWFRFFSSSDNGSRVAVINANRNTTGGLYDNQLMGDYLDSTIVAKFLRFSWANTGGVSQSLNEIMVFGPGGTKFLKTQTDDTPITPILRTMFTRPHQTSGIGVEEFRTRPGTLPATWRTSGDFSWSVDGSGVNTLTNVVTQGNFTGDTHGYYDSFSVRAKPTGPGPASGFLEKEITVFREETRGGEYARRIGFKYRRDMHEGDVFTFATGLPPSGYPFRTLLTASGVGDWTSYSMDLLQASDLNQQTYTLRWGYTRGTGTTTGRLGTVWVDLVEGLDSPPYPSINGFLLCQEPNPTGVIYGYLNSLGWTSIHGFVRATGQAQQIWGYTQSQVFPDTISSINGYLLGASYSSIHGYTLCSSGVDTYSIPTSSIHGYIGGATGVGMSSIHGFVYPMKYSSVHGFVEGPGPTGTSYIRGYVVAREPSAIHGFVQGYRPGQIIYGVLPDAYDVGSGTIHGYLKAWNSSAVHGYVFNSGVSSSIHGYTNATDGFQYIHGFVEGPPGSLSHIYGYTQSANFASGAIHGYVAGGKESGVIHGYASGVGFGSSSINGYLMGISGSINSSIHGYLVGEGFTSSAINGFLIGIYASGINVCSSHNFPLPAVDSGVMPNNWQCNMVV
jgi:hypothetical protein